MPSRGSGMYMYIDRHTTVSENYSKVMCQFQLQQATSFLPIITTYKAISNNADVCIFTQVVLEEVTKLW